MKRYISVTLVAVGFVFWSAHSGAQSSFESLMQAHQQATQQREEYERHVRERELYRLSIRQASQTRQLSDQDIAAEFTARDDFMLSLGEFAEAQMSTNGEILGALQRLEASSHEGADVVNELSSSLMELIEILTDRQDLFSRRLDLYNLRVDDLERQLELRPTLERSPQ